MEEVLSDRPRGVAARRKANRTNEGAVWDRISKITRHRKHWDTVAPAARNEWVHTSGHGHILNMRVGTQFGGRPPREPRE